LANSFVFIGVNMEKNAIHRFKNHLPGVFTQGKNPKKAFHPMTLKDFLCFFNKKTRCRLWEGEGVMYGGGGSYTSYLRGYGLALTFRMGFKSAKYAGMYYNQNYIL